MLFRNLSLLFIIPFLIPTDSIGAAGLPSPGSASVFTQSGSDYGVTWSGTRGTVINIKPQASSGLDAVFVLSSTQGVSVSFPSSGAVWQKYGSSGGVFAEEITSGISRDGTISRLGQTDGDCGYIVRTPDGKQYCFWVVDYSKHVFSANALTESAEKDCAYTTLLFSGSASEINYYGINGQRLILDRQITVEYQTLTPDFENTTFTAVTQTESLAAIGTSFTVPAPLCPTDFRLSGDRFLREWGHEAEIATQSIESYAVSAIASVTQQERQDSGNESAGAGGNGLGGSAPCVINFEAAITDGAIFHEWQFASDPAFENLTLRIPDLSYTHTFTEAGNIYARFVCDNAEGSCEYTTDSYTISIGTSSLLCPNAFSPNGDGINDEWRVSYSSIVDFHCTIFDRYGHKIAELSDPGQGWDGTYKGKPVSSGAYFYVIKAKGADGKAYNLSGDINIVNYK